MIEYKEIVKKSLTNAFNYALDSVQNSIKGFNLTLTIANSLINSIQTKIDMLDLFYTENVLDKLKITKDLFIKELENLKEKYKAKRIEDYLICPPKKDFEKLENPNNFVNSDIIKSLGQIIINKFSEELEISTKKNRREKEQSLKKLTKILETLPDNIKSSIGQEIDRFRDELGTQEDELMKIFSTSLISKDLESLDKYMNECNASARRHEYHLKLNEFINDEINEYRKQVAEDIKNNEMFNAIRCLKRLDDLEIFCKKYLQQIKQVRDYKSLSGMVALEIGEIFSNLKEFFDVQFSMQTLVYDKNQISPLIDKTINTNDLIQTLNNIINLRKDNECVIDRLLPNFYYDYLNLAKVITNSALLLKKKFKESISSINIQVSNIKQVLDIIKKWSVISKELKLFLNSSLNDDEMKDIIIDEVDYTNLIKEFENKIIELKMFFKNIVLINDSTSKYEFERKNYYSDIEKNIETAKDVHRLSEHTKYYSNLQNFESEIIDIIAKKRDDLVEETNILLNFTKLTVENCKMFNIYFSNLCCLTTLKLPNIRNHLYVKNIENKVFTVVDGIKYKIENAEINDAAEALIYMKTISDNIPKFKREIDEQIDIALKNFKLKKGRCGSQVFSKLGSTLNTNPVGKTIIREHKILEGFLIALFNEKVQKHGIDYVLTNITGDSINHDKLRNRYLEFEKFYSEILKRNLKPSMDLKPLVAQINSLFRKSNNKRWDANLMQKIPELVAYIFALWTLTNAEDFFENEDSENQNFYLLKPHAGQVISIFRLLSVGDDKQALVNNLCQIGTGEGKSLVLAVVACLFAISGFKVSCICYSSYLSRRDYKAFSSLFELLGIQDLIEYGTFKTIFAKNVNYENLNEKVRSLLHASPMPTSMKKTQKMKKILLIDEVDVFLSKDFLGKQYKSCVIIEDFIKPLTDYIWEKRENNLDFIGIQNSEVYQSCCEKYKNWELLIEKAVKTMLNDVKDFKNPAYVVENDKIGYVKFDKVETDISFNYKTLFAYYYEHENGNISDASFIENIYLSIISSKLSYAEIPKYFEYVLGVSGTLNTLNDVENEIIKNQYGIQKKTYVPSVFGKNNMRFNEQTDVMIENSDDYYSRIKIEIDNRLLGTNPNTKRSVLVFFESTVELMNFYNSHIFLSYKDYAKILTEERNLTLSERNEFTKEATRSGTINLITRSFGRGTDFTCRDDIVLSNSGVHVLQAFLSENLSEEVQIRGRAARQGESGSYSMVLLDKSLEKYSISTESIQNNQANIYKFINEKRNQFISKEHQSLKKLIENAKIAHKESMEFIKDLKEQNFDMIKAYLQKIN